MGRLIAVLLLMGCTSPTHPKVADPCYSATIYVDSLTFETDSIVWEWTPGECDG